MDNSKADVIVIAGTYEGRELINQLSEIDIQIATTFNNRIGSELINKNPNINIFQNKMTVQGMAKTIKNYQAKCIIDASHPFAIESSKNAMKVAEKLGIKYLRYEKPSFKTESKQIIKVKNFVEAANQATIMDGNIFLFVGTKKLDVFLENIKNFQDRLFIRILPEPETILKCHLAGIPKSNIIALKGEISEELIYELLKHVNAKVIVVMDSGALSGVEQKIRAAERLGIKVILIERPVIEYKEKAGTISETVFWIGNVMANTKSNQ
jgi:precorrin-6x reductase